MTRPTLSELHMIRRSMKKRLAVYMITLGLLLAAALMAGLFFFNQLKSPREELVTSLNFRMEAFASDMESLWRNVSVMGVHLSEDMTDLIEEQTSDFSSLSGDVNAVEALQETMIEPLCQYGRQVDCSGAFERLKNEMFYYVSWAGYSIDQFINAVDQYLHWYCEKRIKLSLGGMSPLEYRQSKGIRTPNLSAG